MAWPVVVTWCAAFLLIGVAIGYEVGRWIWSRTASALAHEARRLQESARREIEKARSALESAKECREQFNREILRLRNDGGEGAGG